MTRIFKDYLIAQTAFLLAAFGLVACGDSSRAARELLKRDPLSREPRLRFMN